MSMPESDKERFSKRLVGEVRVSADIRIAGTTTTQNAAEVKITDPALYDRISQYALRHGEDLQSWRFRDSKYEYVSCFIRNVVAFRATFFDEEELKPLFNHGRGKTAEFLISFPERKH